MAAETAGRINGKSKHVGVPALNTNAGGRRDDPTSVHIGMALLFWVGIVLNGGATHSMLYKRGKIEFFVKQSSSEHTIV